MSAPSIELPPPELLSSLTVEEAIRRRTSCRSYAQQPISGGVLSQLLWSAQGVTASDGRKAAPSAGREYPLRLYVAVGTVSGIPAGAYSYEDRQHALARVSDVDLRKELKQSAIDDQPWLEQAALVIAVAADFARVRKHFETQAPEGERGDRYVYIETGAVAENVHLQATGLGAGVVIVGGFDDQRVKEIFAMPPSLDPTALLCVGCPAE